MSTTISTDPGVSCRNYLGTCIFVWEPMEKTAHGYVILGVQVVTNLKETKEAKYKSFTGFVLEVHELERPQHVQCQLLAAGAAWTSHFHVLRSFQSMHPSHSSGNYYKFFLCF